MQVCGQGQGVGVAYGWAGELCIEISIGKGMTGYR